MFYKFVCFVLLICSKILFRLKVYGKENVNKVKGAAIFAPNHASFLDPPLSAVASPRPLQFFARHTLFRNRFFGTLITHLNAIPVHREAPEIGEFKALLKLLKQDKLVLLFPEGTRTMSGEHQEAKSGLGFIALKARVPIIPVYIHGSYEAWPKEARFPRFTKISITIGEPISLDHWLNKKSTDKKDYHEIVDLVMEKIRELRDNLPQK